MKRILFILSFISCFLFGHSLEEIQSSKTITIGLDADMPPFSVEKDGKFEGFEVEFARRLGYSIVGNDGKVNFVALETKNRAVALNNNQVDVVIQAYTKTPERSKIVDFALPYFSVAIGVLVDKNSNIKNLNDLSGKTIAIEEGTTAQEFFTKRGDVKILLANTSNEGYKMLKEGKADAFSSDNIIVLAYPVFDDTVWIPPLLGNLGVSEYLAPAVSKGNTALKNKIDDLMIKFSKELMFKKIYDENFGIFYRNTINPNQFLLEELYRVYG